MQNCCYPVDTMDVIDARMQQLRVLVESIVTAMKEERDTLHFARQQFELVHPHPHSCLSMPASPKDQRRVADSDARQSDLVKLDVGGSHFHVSRKVLTSEADNLLESLFSGRFKVETQADGTVFIDRLVKLVHTCDKNVNFVLGVIVNIL